MKPRNREAVLLALQAINAAATAAEVAEASGLHIDSARYALDSMCDDAIAGKREPYRNEGRGTRYYLLASSHARVSTIVDEALKTRSPLELAWGALILW
jgi:predicted ArsR family transcriptional regulator